MPDDGYPECPPDHWTLRPALAALEAAIASLDALVSCCCDGFAGCDRCRDAAGCGWALESAARLFESDICGPDPRPSRPHFGDPDAAAEAAVLALYDALDACLDLSVFHCQGEESCCVCDEADDVLYTLRMGIDLLGPSTRPTQRIWRRAWLSAARKLERDRLADADGLPYMPHAAHEHAAAESQVRDAARRLAAWREGGPK